MSTFLSHFPFANCLVLGQIRIISPTNFTNCFKFAQIYPLQWKRRRTFLYVQYCKLRWINENCIFRISTYFYTKHCSVDYKRKTQYSERTSFLLKSTRFYRITRHLIKDSFIKNLRCVFMSHVSECLKKLSVWWFVCLFGYFWGFWSLFFLFFFF